MILYCDLRVAVRPEHIIILRIGRCDIRLLAGRCHRPSIVFSGILESRVADKHIVVACPPDPIRNRIVPGHIDLIILSIQLDDIPRMVHGFTADHVRFDPRLCKQILVGKGISLTHGAPFHQRSVGIVDHLRECSRQIVIIVIGTGHRNIVMEHQCLLHFRHTIIDQRHCILCCLLKCLVIKIIVHINWFYRRDFSTSSITVRISRPDIIKFRMIVDNTVNNRRHGGCIAGRKPVCTDIDRRLFIPQSFIDRLDCFIPETLCLGIHRAVVILRRFDHDIKAARLIECIRIIAVTGLKLSILCRHRVFRDRILGKRLCVVLRAFLVRPAFFLPGLRILFAVFFLRRIILFVLRLRVLLFFRCVLSVFFRLFLLFFLTFAFFCSRLFRQSLFNVCLFFLCQHELLCRHHGACRRLQKHSRRQDPCQNTAANPSHKILSPS